MIFLTLHSFQTWTKRQWFDSWGQLITWYICMHTLTYTHTKCKQSHTHVNWSPLIQYKKHIMFLHLQTNRTIKNVLIANLDWDSKNYEHPHIHKSTIKCTPFVPERGVCQMAIDFMFFSALLCRDSPFFSFSCFVKKKKAFWAPL